MRRLVLLLALAALLVPGAASAAPAGAPEDGFVVYKELRGRGVTEVFDGRGRFLFREAKLGGDNGGLNQCLDVRFRFFGPRWRSVPGFLVNGGSTPAGLDAAEALADLVAANAAWQSPYTTDCVFRFRPASYRSTYEGDTDLPGSLLDGFATDGANVVEFRSLAGTVCDGAVACTILEYARGRINEADMVLESDLGRFGFDDRWTTGDTTWTDPTAGEFAIVDVATHEFGHFAGLDHVERSPSLTMYPLIHDGMQTLGLGDVFGLAVRY